MAIKIYPRKPLYHRDRSNHYLNGWQYSSKRKDEAKEHPCLQPLESFDTDTIKETYQHDIASVYYIPQYLARAGFEVVDN